MSVKSQAKENLAKEKVVAVEEKEVVLEAGKRTLPTTQPKTQPAAFPKTQETQVAHSPVNFKKPWMPTTKELNAKPPTPLIS